MVAALSGVAEHMGISARAARAGWGEVALHEDERYRELSPHEAPRGEIFLCLPVGVAPTPPPWSLQLEGRHDLPSSIELSLLLDGHFKLLGELGTDGARLSARFPLGAPLRGDPEATRPAEVQT